MKPLLITIAIVIVFGVSGLIYLDYMDDEYDREHAERIEKWKSHEVDPEFEKEAEKFYNESVKIESSAKKNTSPQTCISALDGQHIRMKRDVSEIARKNRIKNVNHEYTGYNPRNATAGQQVTMWSCFSGKINGKPMKFQLYYKTTVPHSERIDTNDPNWCPIYEIESVLGCE